MRYSSKDFGRTKAVLAVELPDRLVHRDVEGNARDEQFSGERKHPVFVVDLPSKTLSVTIGGLAAGQTGTSAKWGRQGSDQSNRSLFVGSGSTANLSFLLPRQRFR